MIFLRALCLPQKHLCESALEVLLWQLAHLRGALSTLPPPGGLMVCETRRDGLVGLSAPAPLQGPSPCEPEGAT